MSEQIDECVLSCIAVSRNEVSDIFHTVSFEQRPSVVTETRLEIGQFARRRVVGAEFEYVGVVHVPILVAIRAVIVLRAVRLM
jgi:hypothetical protein